MPYQVRWPTVPGTSDFRTKYGTHAPQISQNRTLVRGPIRLLLDLVLNKPVPYIRTSFLPWYGVNSTGWQGTGTSGTRTAVPYRTVPAPYRTRHKSGGRSLKRGLLSFKEKVRQELGVGIVIVRFFLAKAFCSLPTPSPGLLFGDSVDLPPEDFCVVNRL